MGIIDVMFPIKCVGCREGGKYICNECWKGVRGSSRPFERISNSEMSRVYAIYQYGGVIQQLLKKVKYKSSWKMVDELAEKWMRRVSDELLDEVSDRKAVVTSVPMYHVRQRERGFNQAERLGRKLAERLDLEYTETLERVRATKPMYGLSKKDRRENIEGAFMLNSNNQITNNKQIQNSNNKISKLVILVDDVWTTGSTMGECARVLGRKGAEEVWGVVVAR